MCSPGLLAWPLLLSLLITAAAASQLVPNGLPRHGTNKFRVGDESSWKRQALNKAQPSPAEAGEHWGWLGQSQQQHGHLLTRVSTAAVNRLVETQPRPHISTHERLGHRQLLQSGGQARAQSINSTALDSWAQSSQQYSKRYAMGSCFADYPGFIAKDITDFVRLIKDPAATHIELKGNLKFTSDLFPPENANDQSKGINITHKVEIRACTNVQEPIIVDVNNVLQQIYVYGRMTWQGSIKFINTFPSQRRGGLFPLISVLSVEADGVIEFKGLQIHGNEPSPLFNDNDPFWEVYQDQSKFVPQPQQYTRVDSNTLVMHDWRFNKTAWVLKSQGTQGVVRAKGDGYWQWLDVLISWSPPSGSGGRGGLVGPALALAVALPVVLGSLLLAAGGGLLWWGCRRRRRRYRQHQHTITVDASDKPGLEVPPSAPSRTSNTNTGFGPNSYTGGSTGECVKMEMSSGSMATTQLIEQARRRMQANAATREASIVLETLLGEGTFGKVYSANWKGTLVAVKTMLLPAAMSGKERREKMAIMETAISSSLSHPNIVQTYTYEVKPLSGELARKALDKTSPNNEWLHADAADSTATFMDDTSHSTDNHGWEVRLVLELCDLGNLKEFLGRGGFKLADGQQDMSSVVATALDIARAMLHLHTENIIHSDLKARNVLLKSAGADVRGFVAKVSDFGLSMRIDPSETHVSNFYQGTLTHMAPEVLMYGKISFASDVYAFGIMLWEMYTARQAFKGVPRALLGHEVTQMGRRPEFPPDCPFDFQLLACRCWESDPAIRPTFAHILADLERMNSKLHGRRMDSASSLHPNAQRLHSNTAVAAAAAGDAGHLGHLTHAAAAGPQAGVTAAAVAAAAGAAVTATRLPSPDTAQDAAKYHHWEPQTSLLELGSTLGGSTDHPGTSDQEDLQPVQQHAEVQREHAAAARQQPPGWELSGAGGRGAGPVASDCAPSSHKLGQFGSLGSWNAPSGGGLWLSGSLAPVSLCGEGNLGQQRLGQQGMLLATQPSGATGAVGDQRLLVQQYQQPAHVHAAALQHQGGPRQWPQSQAQQELLQPAQQQQPFQHVQAAASAHNAQGVRLQQAALLQQQEAELLRQHRERLLQQQRQGLIARAAGVTPSQDASSTGVYLDNSSTVVEGSTVGTCEPAGTSSTDNGGLGSKSMCSNRQMPAARA